MHTSAFSPLPQSQTFAHRFAGGADYYNEQMHGCYSSKGAVRKGHEGAAVSGKGDNAAGAFVVLISYTCCEYILAEQPTEKQQDCTRLAFDSIK